jgi:hypothetical protein
MMYTGNTANDGDFTLTPKDTDPSSSTDLADSKSSDSDFLINAGIVVSVIIILVSGAAMVSMMNKSEEDTIGMVKAGFVDQTSSDTVDSPDENGEPKSEESSD